MKRIKNVVIMNAFGEPYPMIERRCPPDCSGSECMAQTHLIHCKGQSGVQGCTEQAHVQRVTKPLSGWIKSILINLGQVAARNLTMVDNEHAYAVLRACRRAEHGHDDGVGGTLRLEDDNHAWLMKTLFDDETGKRLGKVQGQNGEWLNPAGAIAVQFTDPWMCVVMKRLLDGLPLIEEEAETDDDDVIAMPELQDAVAE